jgi:hypothetical protein
MKNAVTIIRASDAPKHLQRAAKCALAVGATVRVDADSCLFVTFPGALDNYVFEPETITTHALELLHVARVSGFACYMSQPEPPFALVSHRIPYVVRLALSAEDVRVQLGASRWYQSKFLGTERALREATVAAFVDYYDGMIASHVNNAEA